MDKKFIEELIETTGLCATKKTKIKCKQKGNGTEVKIFIRGFDFSFFHEEIVNGELELTAFLVEAEEMLFEELKKFAELI